MISQRLKTNMALAARSYRLGVSVVSKSAVQLWIDRTISSTQVQCAGSKWRLAQGLGRFGNEYGPLTEIPDWSYADGRPAPLGPRETIRRQKQKDLAAKAVQYIEEMKIAKKNYSKKSLQKGDTRQ